MGGRGARSSGSGSVGGVSRDVANLVLGKTHDELFNDHDTIRQLIKMGYKRPEMVEDAWYKANMANSVKNLHEVDEYKTADIIRDNVPDNVRKGWFVNADSSYKPRIESAIISNPDVRNATLNMAWKNYNDYLAGEGKTGVSYKTFLNTPITVFRGDNGQKKIKDDTFMSYSYSKKVAEKFGKNITTKTVKPIDTLGQMQTNSEYELMIPTR